MRSFRSLLAAVAALALAACASRGGASSESNATPAPPPEGRAASPPPDAEPLIDTQHRSLFYGAAQAWKDVSFTIQERLVTAFIGPSGCGKSTLLRC